MKHFTSPSFWSAYNALPLSVRRIADRNFDLIKRKPKHSSLHLKKINRYWSVRIGIRYRALAVEIDDGFLRLWIGSHAEYDKLIH